MNIRIVFGNYNGICYVPTEEEAKALIAKCLEESSANPVLVENVNEDGEVKHAYEVEVTVTLKPVASRES
jgi:hypothetical protein